MEEKYFRNKITWFTFIYSLLVIWVHSYNAVLFLGNTKAAYKIDWLERFLGNTVAQIAVPGFFLISSYLFFRGFTMKRLWVKWNSRIRSVLVPYIMWNFIYYLGYVIGSRIPVLSEIIGKGKVPLTVSEAAQAVLHYSYNYVFWYLNQLILLILLAPVIYILIKQWQLGSLFLMAILVGIYFGLELPFLNLDALLYYSFGAFTAVHGKNIAQSPWSLKKCMAGVVIFITAYFLKGVDFPGDIRGEIAASLVCFRLLAPVGLWLLIPKKYLAEPKEWMKHNFFLYAIHFSLVRLINKTGALLLPAVPAVPFGLYLIMPVVCVFFSYQIGRFLRHFLPSLWYLLNGGR